MTRSLCLAVVAFVTLLGCLGQPPDAGSPGSAGHPNHPADAGAVGDAGALDAGSPSDAGASGDAGSQVASVPAVPVGLVATPGPSQVSLTWSANAASDGVVRYQVYRADVLVADGPATPAYVDTGLSNGTTYSYRVSAWNAAGYGAWTAAVSATPQSARDGGGEGDAGTGTVFNPPYPRIGAYPIGSPQTYDAAFRATAAKCHVVIMSNWQGYSGDLPSMAAVFRDIKSRSTVGTKLFSYVNQNETEPWLEYPILSKVSSERWYLYPSGSSGTPVASAYGGATEANSTMFAKPDAQGKIWIDWYADFRYAAFVAGDSKDVPNPDIDGFFMDNVSWKPMVDGDWNLDGVKDSQNDPQVQGWYRAGYQHYFQYMQHIWPGSIQLGNVANWYDTSGTLGVYDQMAGGGVLEGYFGETWSIETWAGFNAMMAGYRKTMDALKPPKLGVLGDDQAPTDYQGMRYALAATSMDDGFYYHANGSSYAPPLQWYDEFDFNLGYPSTAQGSRQSAPWSQGVWRRDFDNGIVLVNPKGNGQQTVNLGGTFRRLVGSQDPTTNSGATVTSVTLKDRDGIILRR